MEGAFASATLLAPPLMELVFDPRNLDALHEATGMVAAALLFAAAAILVRFGVRVKTLTPVGG